MKRIISLISAISIAIMLLSSFTVVSADESSLSELITYDAPKDAFDYYIEGDPLDISDEDFFGVWDEQTKAWTSTPYLDYEKFDGLSKVEEAAKDEDYEAAKDELLAYYRTVRDDRVTDVKTHPGKRALLIAEAQTKNAYTVNGSQCGYIAGMATVDNDWKECRVDVTDRFGLNVAGIQNYRGFAIMSVDKFMTYAEIKSRESGSPARLELVINGGVSVSIPASADMTTRGGVYSKTNYGSGETLRVQSSGYYHNFNENTYNSYICFDISFLKTTDVINSATFVFRGRNASGTGEKELVIYQQNNINFDETTGCFDDYATEDLFWSCNDQNTWDYVASSDTALKGKACFYHRGGETDYTAKLYSFTKNEKYAFTYLRQYMGMVNGAGADPEYFNALDMGVNLDVSTKNVLQVMDSKYITGDMLTGMIKQFWLMSDYLVNEFYGKRSNNWASFATKGVYAFISRFPEMAIHDEWFEITQAENTRIVGGLTFEDGMCIELSMSYVSTLLDTLSGPLDINEETGAPLPYDDVVMEQTHSLVKNLLYATGPNLRGWGIGEGNDMYGTQNNNVQYWYKSVFQDDEELEYVATKGLSGKLPEIATYNYPYGLRTYFRSEWLDMDSIQMAVTAKATGSHTHRDMLSLCLHAYGEYLLTDQQYGASLTDGSTEYMAQSGQHNLVTINDMNNNKVDGVQEAFEANSIYDFVEYSGDFTGVAEQRRSVIFLKKQKFFIVTDFAEPYNKRNVNTYKQNWHMLPAANMTIDPDSYIIRSNMENANVLVVPVDTENLTALKEDARWATSGNFTDTKKSVLKQEVAGNAKYTTVIIPVDDNENFEVETTPIDTGLSDNIANAFACKITNKVTGEVNNYYYYHHNKPEEKQAVTIGGYETDATTLFIQLDKDKNFVSMFLMDATFLNDDSLGSNKVRFKSNTPVGAIAYEESGRISKIYSSTITDEEQLDDITFYTGYNNGMRLNGTTVPNKKSGGYMYFGDTPIVEGEKLPEQSDGGKDTGNNHGTGGGGGGGAIAPPKDNNPVIPDDTNKGDDNKEEIKIPENVSEELKGHWGKELIENLYKDGIITGDSNGLRLKDSVTRAEFTVLLVRALNFEKADYNNEFMDIYQEDWYSPYVAAAYEKGLVQGSDGMFRPTDTITREEMCKIISSLLEEKPTTEIKFNDIDSISPWASDSVKKAYSNGIINGMDDGSFAPKNSALREQAFVILSRLMGVLSK